MHGTERGRGADRGRLQPHWPDRLATLARRRRGGRRTRRLRRLAALLLLIAAAALALTREPAPRVGTPVVAVLRDLPTGAALALEDLRVVDVIQPPDGALTEVGAATGRALTGPIRRGELVTDARLVPTHGADPGPGRVAVPIRPADPAAVDLLSPGVHVAILTAGANGRAAVLAGDAVVLTVQPAGTSGNAGRLVVVAVPTRQADRLAAAAIDGELALRFT